MFASATLQLGNVPSRGIELQNKIFIASSVCQTRAHATLKKYFGCEYLCARIKRELRCTHAKLTDI